MDSAVASSPQSTSASGHKRSSSLGSVAPSEDISAKDVDAGPPPAKRQLSLSSERDDDGSSSESEPEFAAVVDGTPHSNRNTASSTKWALKNFRTWQQKRIAGFPGDKEEHPPSDLLTSTDPEVISKWFELFAAETRKRDGSPFPAKSLYHLLTGLLRHMRSLNPRCPNFLQAECTQFSRLHKSLEKICRDNCEAIADINTRIPFTADEEDLLWTSGALSTESPRALLRAVYFLNSKNLGLNSSCRHRHLKLSHLKRLSQPDRYVYNFPSIAGAGLSVLRHKRKMSMCIVAAPEKGNSCHVHVLDIYMKKLPPGAFEMDVFYLRPANDRLLVDTSPWFTVCPVGRNSLDKLLREICIISGLNQSRKPHLRLLCAESPERVQSEAMSTSFQSTQNFLPTHVYMFHSATTLNQQSSLVQGAAGTQSIILPLSSPGPHTPNTTPQENASSPHSGRNQSVYFVPTVPPAQFAAIPQSPSCTTNDKAPEKQSEDATSSKAALHTSREMSTATQQTDNSQTATPESPQPTTTTTVNHSPPMDTGQHSGPVNPTVIQQSVIDLTDEAVQQSTAAQPQPCSVLPQTSNQPNFTLPQLVFNNCHVSIFVTQSQTQMPEI